MARDDPAMTTTLRLDDEAAVHRSLEALAEQGELPPGSLLVFLADDDARATLSVGIDEVPRDPPQDQRVGTLGPFLRRLRTRSTSTASCWWWYVRAARGSAVATSPGMTRSPRRRVRPTSCVTASTSPPRPASPVFVPR